MPNETRYDLIIVGAGSGGIGAAIASSRMGAKTLLIEKAGQIGGTAIRSGVSCWEPGVGGTGIPFDIYCRLKRISNAVCIYSIGRHCLWPDASSAHPPYPGGESLIDPAMTYIDSLRRHGAVSMAESEKFCRKNWHGVVFEPDAYCKAVEAMLSETGDCTLLKSASFKKVNVRDRHIESLLLTTGEYVSAPTFIDATGDGLLASAAGARTRFGQESRQEFSEPDAPLEPTERVNGITLMFRTQKLAADEKAEISPLLESIPEKCWWRNQFPAVSVNQFPCGDLSINMLPTMEGAEFISMSATEAYAECRHRVLAQWHHLQVTFPEFRSFRLADFAPELGIRERQRILGEYTLTEHDLLNGISRQTHPDIIALADHAMDTHGSSTGRGGCRELAEPYGIPFRCLIPKGFDNLLVASRAASFSSIAASSCRLSRTMMQLGQAAGTAAAIAKENGVPAANVPVNVLRDALRRQHVQLEWPMQPENVAQLKKR